MLALLAALLAGCSRSGPPFSPKQALKTFQLEPGFQIDTFVTEPDIVSPVAMEFDENGRIYVVEDPGYPLNVEGKVGKVKLLEDTDGDGRPDKVTVFAEGLVMPNGIMRWKKGVLVTDAPNVWYFEDTNGDGKADVKKVVLTGFAFSNPQHTVNGPQYGLDNWIYLAHEGPATAIIFRDKFGDPGSDIRFPDRPDLPGVSVGRRNLRFRPDSYQLEALSSSTQFGNTFDEWGHIFTHNNSNHARHEVIAARYLKRNPELPVASAMANISDHGSNAQVYPITRSPRFEMLTEAGEFTSACSLSLYLGGAFPAALGNFSLVAEPAHNLVHRDLWSAAGATFTLKRAREGVEFLASTDAWFRPVNFYTGPDGAIYVLDFYHLSIEHPEWTSTHTHSSPDLYKGQDRGRIYRITPAGGSLPLAKKIQLGKASGEALVQQLRSPNVWWRRNAQRLLVDHGGARAVDALGRLFETADSGVARVRVLWTLEGLGKLEAGLIEKALDDKEAGVRENAIILAESRLPALAPKLLKMENDPDPRVRFQLLDTLGFIDSPSSRAAQDRLLALDIEDPWVQIAALSASSDRAPQLFEAARALTDKQTDARTVLFRQVGAVIGARNQDPEIRRVLTAVQTGAAWWRAATLEGLATGLRRKQGAAGEDLLIKLFQGPDATVRRASLRLLAVVALPQNRALAQRAAATAQDRSADADLRADSIGLLALAGRRTGNPEANPSQEELFKKLIDPHQPEQVQAAAVRALGRLKGDEIGDFLLERWRAMTPRVRSDAADALLLEPGRSWKLVEAIRNDQVQPWTMSFRQKRALIMHRDAKLRDAARPLLEAKAGEREKVLERYRAALEKNGDAARGKQVFERVCAKCHQFAGLGHEVGPDLGTVRNRSAAMILPEIIIPSRSISQGYEAYVVETKSAGAIEGVIGPQTPTTITIRHEEGKQDVIRRDDIKEMHATNLSAMPEDLDKQISVEQMADLLKFLKTGR